MSVLPLTFDNKVDSPELVALLVQFGAEKKLTAAEVNLIRDAINELKQSFDDIDFPDTSSFATTTQLNEGLDEKLDIPTGTTDQYLDGQGTPKDFPIVYENVFTNTSVTGAYAINYNIDIHRLTLTGNTTFTESNLPPTAKARTITLEVNGNFGVVFPAGFATFLTGEFKGTATLNTIVIECFGNFRKVQISQPS